MLYIATINVECDSNITYIIRPITKYQHPLSLLISIFNHLSEVNVYFVVHTSRYGNNLTLAINNFNG